MRVLLLAAALATSPAAAADLFGRSLGGPFSLVDQTGAARTEADLRGTPSLLFFGYAGCQAICSVALPRMAETVDLLAERGIAARPVLVTVDPARDTPERLAEAAPAIHPDLMALTGSEAALDAAMAAWGVEAEVVGEDPLGPIYAHGSYVYLIDADGETVTLMPPVLGPKRMAEIAAGYLAN